MVQLLKQFIKYIRESGIRDRLFFVRVIVCVGFIAGLVISHPLWINDRFYPLVPAADFIPVLSPPLGTVIFAGILILLAVLIFYPQKYVFLGFFSLMGFALLQDQSRLYPWVYQYIFMLGAIAWSQLNLNQERKKQTLFCIQLILIGTYIWSGLHKLNYTYIFNTFEWLISPALNAFPFLNSLPFPLLAILTAIIETVSGIALIYRATRQIGTWILIGMHIFILLMVGPTGMEYNKVVWPWNICFILLLSAIFLGKKSINQSVTYLFPKNYYHGFIIVLFLIMPALNFAGLWDHFPSASLYSGKKPYAKIHVTNTVKKHFPKKLQPKFSLMNELTTRDWAYKELNVPDYPQPRVYKAMFRKLCKYQEHKYGLVLEIYNTADVITGNRKREEYFCHELATTN